MAWWVSQCSGDGLHVRWKRNEHKTARTGGAHRTIARRYRDCLETYRSRKSLDVILSRNAAQYRSRHSRPTSRREHRPALARVFFQFSNDVARSMKHIAESQSDELFVCRQGYGSLALRQDGRELTLSAGDVALPSRKFKGVQ
jgi:hypothetical protein